jgi:hypothetical protein
MRWLAVKTICLHSSLIETIALAPGIRRSRILFELPVKPTSERTFLGPTVVSLQQQ